MKTRIVKKGSMIMLVAIFMMGISMATVNAQRSNQHSSHRGVHKKDVKPGSCHGIPDLTEEQMQQIEELRTMHMKETMPLKNEMDVKQAELKSLSSGDDVNMKDVNNKIDEISVLHVEMMKKRVAHKQEVRKLLNDKQRIYFDAQAAHHGKGMHSKGRYAKGMCGKRGHGSQQPPCPYGMDGDDE